MIELPHPFPLYKTHSTSPPLFSKTKHLSQPSSFKPFSLSLFPLEANKKLTQIKQLSSEGSFSLTEKTSQPTMMVEREDLGLSLSLSAFPHQTHHPNNNNNNNHTFQLNLMPSLVPTSSSPHSGFNPQKPSWNDALASSDRNSDTCRGPARSFLRGIDVNRLPSTGDCEDVSSPNSTVSSVSGKRSEREANGEELDLERDGSRGMSDEEDGETSRKKLRLSKDQSAILEESFKEHNTLNPKQKLALAKQLGLRPRQVEVWFQNRRARTKLKQTEVDCEFLKRCCENLTEENRRLQKEVQELRALKLSPQFYMQMTPPTTLTMCPSCERVAVPPNSTSPSATVNPRAHHHHHPMVPVHHPRAIPVAGPWAAAAPVLQQQRQFEPFRTARP